MDSARKQMFLMVREVLSCRRFPPPFHVRVLSPGDARPALTSLAYARAHNSTKTRASTRIVFPQISPRSLSTTKTTSEISAPYGGGREERRGCVKVARSLNCLPSGSALITRELARQLCRLI